MSDDFLSDVSSAVSSGQTSVPAPTVQEVTGTDSPSITKHNNDPLSKPQSSQASVENDLNSLFERNEVTEIKKEDNAFAPKKEEAKKAEEQKTAPKQEVTKDRNPRKPHSERLLDTFLDEDEDGNLRNSEGEIIALAGKSRQYYEGIKNEARKQRQAAMDLAKSHSDLARQFRALYEEYKGMEGKTADPVQSIVKEAGFTESEAKQALGFLKQYKHDPITAIKGMLTQAKLSGIDISKIGANISVDPAILKSTVGEILNEHLRPLTEREQRTSAQEAAETEARQFLTDHPGARPFANLIAEAKERYPEMSLNDIWGRLRSELEKRRPPREERYRPVTTHRNEQRNPPRETRRPAVQVPQRDYAKMSFDEIAKSIIEDSSR